MKKNIIRKKHIILPTSLVMCSAFAMPQEQISAHENSSCVSSASLQNTDNIQGIAQASESRTFSDNQASEAVSYEQRQLAFEEVSHSRLFSRKETSPPQLANGVNTPPATPCRAQQMQQDAEQALSTDILLKTVAEKQASEAVSYEQSQESVKEALSPFTSAQTSYTYMSLSRTLLDSQASEAASYEQNQESVKEALSPFTSTYMSLCCISEPSAQNTASFPSVSADAQEVSKEETAQQIAALLPLSAEQISTTYTLVSGTCSEASLYSPIAQASSLYETPETIEVTGEEDIKTRPVDAVEQGKLDHQSASEKNSNLFYIIGKTFMACIAIGLVVAATSFNIVRA